MSLAALEWIAYLQTLLSGGVAWFAFAQSKKSSSVIFLIGCLFLIGFLTNSVSLLSYRSGIPIPVNVPQSIYNGFSIIILGSIYFYATGKRYKVVLFITGLCVAFFLFNLFYLQKTEIDSYSKTVNSFAVMSFAIFYFFRLIIELPERSVQKIPMFWFNTGFLIYYSGSLLLFLITSYLVTVEQSDLLTFWTFHNILSIVEHLIILYGLQLARQRWSLKGFSP